jgi:outer membrane lipoprotein-sorting protein
MARICPVSVGHSNCSSLLATGEKRTISATRCHYASALAYSFDLAQFQLRGSSKSLQSVQISFKEPTAGERQLDGV